MLEVGTQEGQGTEMGRRPREQRPVCPDVEERNAAHPAWPAPSPGQGCPPRDRSLLGASTVPGVRLHPWAPQVGKPGASQMLRWRGELKGVCPREEEAPLPDPVPQPGPRQWGPWASSPTLSFPGRQGPPLSSPAPRGQTLL